MIFTNETDEKCDCSHIEPTIVNYWATHTIL